MRKRFLIALVIIVVIILIPFYFTELLLFINNDPDLVSVNCFWMWVMGVGCLLCIAGICRIIIYITVYILDYIIEGEY